MCEENRYGGRDVRVLLFHPWGRFDPAFCGAACAACAQLEYAQHRGWEVHCIVQEIPAWGLFAGESTELTSRFACVKSVRALRLDCPPVAPRRYGDEFRSLLYASERAARRAAFRAVAGEPWDAFVTTDVTAVPFALALLYRVRKVLAAGDSYARRAAATELAPPGLREAEARFTFTRVEAELYRLFDRVLFPSEAEALRARRHGVGGAMHVPPLIDAPESPAAPNGAEHDLLLCGGTCSGDLADAEWFYRHIYLPHLRAHGVRLTLAGPVAARFPVIDVRVTKLPGARIAERARVVVAPACEAAGPYPAVQDALAGGRAVVSTPLGLHGLDRSADAAVVIDMRRDPAGTAAAIRSLLASPDRREAIGERAREVAHRHTRERAFAALDSAWEIPIHRRAHAAVA